MAKDHKEVEKALLTLAIMSLIIGLMIYYFLAYLKTEDVGFVSRMNRKCVNMSEYLSIIKNDYPKCMEIYNDEVLCTQDGSKYDIYCYYGDCKTLSPIINERTVPTCVCTIIRDGVSSSICIRTTS